MDVTIIESLTKDWGNGTIFSECELLYNLAKQSKGDIVEIGSWVGKSTAFLAFGTNDGENKNVYAIDPHIYGTKERFLNNLKFLIQNGLSEKTIIPIAMSSEEAINSSQGFNEIDIGLIFIDGDHTYEGVKKDFDLWFNKLAINGHIAFHDSDWVAVDNFLKKEVYQ
jgi:predicted O-methyltransferase YrrM